MQHCKGLRAIKNQRRQLKALTKDKFQEYTSIPEKVSGTDI